MKRLVIAVAIRPKAPAEVAAVILTEGPNGAAVEVEGIEGTASHDAAQFIAEAVKEAAEKSTPADQQSAFAKMSRHLKPVE